MSYNAMVHKIDFIRDIPGRDKIKIAGIGGYQIIVSSDVKEGDRGVLFEQGGALSEEFAKVHDLVKRKDKFGNPAGGYFEENRRIKALRMAGVKSEGFWCPISYFEYTGYDLSSLKEGDTFDKLNGHLICVKYETPATKRLQTQNRSARRGETPMFKKQFDISPFRQAAVLIPYGSVIYVTEKLHGTSFRYGKVLEAVEYPWWKRWLLKVVDNVEVFDWVNLVGSKNVILDHKPEDWTGYYGDETFRYKAVSGINLRKGETIYGELVGYTNTGSPIMAKQSTDVLKDKSIKDRFGKEITYTYGCDSSECKAFIYRITMTNEDGNTVELSWPQVVQRCKELGVPHVPLKYVKLYVCDEDGDVTENMREQLAEEIDLMVNGASGTEAIASLLDSRHLQEGVVLRCESEYGTMFLKHKSVVFGILEGYLKEDDSYVDLEEVS